MEMLAGGVGGPRQDFPCSLLPGLPSNRGPQTSFVFRTEDVSSLAEISPLSNLTLLLALAQHLLPHRRFTALTITS